MFSFPCFPLGGPFVYLLYTFGSSKVLFGGLIYFAFIHQKKNKTICNIYLTLT